MFLLAKPSMDGVQWVVLEAFFLVFIVPPGLLVALILFLRAIRKIAERRETDKLRLPPETGICLNCGYDLTANVSGRREPQVRSSLNRMIDLPFPQKLVGAGIVFRG